MSKEEQLSLADRITVASGEGLLTEADLSLLLNLPVKRVVSYIDEGRLPGKRVGPQGSRVRTLTSIRQLIEFIEKASKEDEK